MYKYKMFSQIVRVLFTVLLSTGTLELVIPALAEAGGDGPEPKIYVASAFDCSGFLHAEFIPCTLVTFSGKDLAFEDMTTGEFESDSIDDMFAGVNVEEYKRIGNEFILYCVPVSLPGTTVNFKHKTEVDDIRGWVHVTSVKKLLTPFCKSDIPIREIP